jgi:2-(3-amino-3-carboxypropyl)histidine synthase
MPSFDFEEQRIVNEIQRLSAKRVVLQMPQGLKPEAAKLAKLVEDAGAVAIISSDPCYGACDIALFEAESLGADLVVHFGHSKMVHDENTHALYIETHAKIDIEPALKQALSLLADYKTVGLTTSIQHINTLSSAQQFLEAAGKTVLIGDAGQLAHPGQVIGCNYSNPKAVADQVEAFLFVGGGIFHALGIALGTGKPVIIADPYDNRAYSITDEAQKLLRQRYANIMAAKDAKTFGILIGVKPGQKHLDHALKAKAIAEKTGRTAYLMAGREITPDALLEFSQFDAYVNTACPRISLDSPGKFQKPILTLNEFMVLCGDVSWNDMIKKGLFEN